MLQRKEGWGGRRRRVCARSEQRGLRGRRRMSWGIALGWIIVCIMRALCRGRRGCRRICGSLHIYAPFAWRSYRTPSPASWVVEERVKGRAM